MTLPRLKHYWTFDETSGTAALDAAGQAAMTLDVESWRVSHVGGGVRFNPKDGAHIGRTALGSLPPPWTVAVWVKREADDTSGAGCSTLFAYWKPNSNEKPAGYAIKLEQYPNTHLVGITCFSEKDHCFNYKLPLDEWKFLTLVGTDGSDGKDKNTTLYVDGQFQSVLPVSIELPLAIIGSNDGTEVCSAILDELRVYGEALTPDQVEELHKLSVAMAPKLVVEVNGDRASSGGVTDLGTVAVGQSATAKIVITSGTEATLTYLASGVDVFVTTNLPSVNDTASAPGAMPATYSLTFTPKVAGPLNVTIKITSSDPNVAEFTYTVSVNGSGTNTGGTGGSGGTGTTNTGGTGGTNTGGSGGSGGTTTTTGGSTGTTSGTSLGLPGDLSVSIGATTIANGGTYDIGSFTLPVQAQELTVTIHNNTSSVLSLPDVPPVALGDANVGFALTSQPTSPIRQGKTGEFKMRFSPTSTGTKTTAVRFANSIKSKNPFSFTLTGTAAPMGLRGQEKTIVCDGNVMAILRQNGKLWVRAIFQGGTEWEEVQLPENRKIVAIDSIFGSCIIALTDAGELWTNEPYCTSKQVFDYRYRRTDTVYTYNTTFPYHRKNFYSVVDGCVLFSTCTPTEEQNSGARDYLRGRSALTAVKADGTLFAPGSADLGGGSNSGAITLPNTVMLKRGVDFSAALSQDGTVRTWGYNYDYQCGTHSRDSVVRAAKIEELSDIVHFDISRESVFKFGLAVNKDGTVYGWGKDGGCLGVVKTVSERATTTYQIGPAKIHEGTLTNIKAVFCGRSKGQAFAIDNDGNLWSWGYAGVLGREVKNDTIAPPDIVPVEGKVVAVQFSGNTGLILTEDGTPYWFGCLQSSLNSVRPVRFDEFTGND